MPNPRLLIALHSPNALPQTGLLMCLPEKRRTLTAFGAEQSVPQSGLSTNYREIRASFAYFGGQRGELSLQLRLRGGEGGIRTLGTGVSPYNGLAKPPHSATLPPLRRARNKVYH